MERHVVAKTQQNSTRVNHAQRQASGPSVTAHSMAGVQSSIGNHALQRLISSRYIQTKLQISTPGDPFEQEADRVADTVMRMPDPVVSEQRAATGIQTKPLASHITPLIHRQVKPVEEEEEVVATKPILQLVPLAVREDEEDEQKVAREVETNPVPQEEEKEKTIATKPISDAPLQRQSKDEDKEETPDVAPAIQRQKEEEDEEIAPKLFRQVTPNPVVSLSPQRPSVYRSVSVPRLPTISIQRLCTECDDELVQPKLFDGRPMRSAPQIQMKEGVGQTSEVASSLAADVSALHGRGSPLPPATRSFFESRFGADFSHVRVHTDSRAAETANSIHARAFTVGPNIAFGPGQYSPESREGKEILAHELTHVVQQSGGQLQRAQPDTGFSTPDDENAVHRKCSACEQEETLQKKSGPEETAASPDIESRLMNSKGSGSPLPSTIREQMESSFDADFSNVRIHTSSTAVGMNKDLHAHAFTHGSDIYFNSGKFDTNSQSGKHLLAHELTHTVQQQGGGARRKIQRWPDWVSDAAGWVSDTASDAAGAVVEGAEYVGGKVVGGARWVGGQVADGARWVGEQISAAAQWVIDQIRSVINSGTNYLTEQWENIKQFGSSCFDTIKTGFGDLVHFVTNPLSSLMSALSAMDAGLLGSVWRLLKTGANALSEGIDSVINGVLQNGQGIWSTVSGFIDGTFNTIAGLFDNSAFDLLPDFIKNEARSILDGLRSLWNQVSTFWTDLWQRLTSSVQEILAGVRSFVENVIGFSIDSVISMVRGLKEVYDYVMKFFADPRATIQPFLDRIAAKLNAEAPPLANTLGNQMAQDNYQGGVTPTTASGNIQRQESGSEDRDTASFDEVGKGILYYIAKFWAELDIKEMLWQTVVNSFWPPATLEAICKQFSDLRDDHWATTVDSLYTPRNFFDHPIGCLHDIWSNFLILLDFPLSLWRTLNHVLGLLIGYVTIIVVLVEAVLGGIAAAEVGVVPGLLAGAAAGLATMAPVAEALMASYLLAESSTVVIILVRLYTARQTCEKRQVDISTSVASFIAMAVALVLQVLMALLAELVNLIAGVLKGSPKPAPQPQPQPVAPPAQPALPPAQPGLPPIHPPVHVPVPAQPAAPVQPAAPAGGGQVIPFPGRRAPEPVTPSVPGQIAAKFEDGVNDISLLQTSPEDKKSLDGLTNGSEGIQESNHEEETIALSAVPGSEDGIVQMARKDKIDPDACKEEKCDLPYKWTRNNPTVPGNEVLRYCEKKKNNFQKDGHHSWPKYLGGPEDQRQLLPVDHNVHMQEFHGNQGRIGPNPPIHTHIETYLNSSNDYKNLLVKDGQRYPLTTRTASTGNQLLIGAMRIGGGNDAVLRSRVKNQMMLFYGLYSAASQPQMPVSAYSVGLNAAENNIV